MGSKPNKTALMRLTPAQWRYHAKAHATPDRIITGAVACSMRAAELLVSAGLWSKAGTEPYGQSRVIHVFRLTEYGRRVKTRDDALRSQ